MSMQALWSCTEPWTWLGLNTPWSCLDSFNRFPFNLCAMCKIKWDNEACVGDLKPQLIYSLSSCGSPLTSLGQFLSPQPPIPLQQPLLPSTPEGWWPWCTFLNWSSSCWGRGTRQTSSPMCPEVFPNQPSGSILGSWTHSMPAGPSVPPSNLTESGLCLPPPGSNQGIWIV